MNAHDTVRMTHFAILDRIQQSEAIHRLALAGMTDYGISHATGLAVEQIRRALAQNELGSSLK